MSIIVAGATGAIGSEVVVHAVKDPRIRRVVALTRRAIAPADYGAHFPNIDATLAATKLQVAPINWEALTNELITPEKAAAAGSERDATLDTVPTVFAGHDYAAMCLGTTRKDAGSDEAFIRVDLEYARAFIEAVKRHSGGTLRHFAQVSSQGASSSSMFLYMRTKGLADQAAAAAGFPKTVFYRPGLLGRGEKARTGEKILGWIIGSMPVGRVAMALVSGVLEDPLAVTVLAGAASGTGGEVSVVGDGGIRQMTPSWQNPATK